MGTKVNSNYEDLINFVRASSTNGTGAMALRPVSYGDELVVNGTFNSDLSDWTDNVSKWSVSGSRAYHAPNLTFAVLRQSVPLTVGKIYRITFDYEVVQGQLRCQARDSSNQPNGDTLAIHDLTGTGSASVIFVPDSDYDSIGFARDDVGVTSEMYVDNVSVKEVLFDQPDGTLTLFPHPENVPRVEYDADGNRLGLLVEESRTNLVTYSEDFSNASWSKNASSIDLSVYGGATPDGQTSGFEITEPSTTSTHGLRATLPFTSGQVYTLSIFAKASTSDWCQLLFGAAAFPTLHQNFNLSTGEKGEGSGFDSSQIENFGGGWYRISITATATSTASTDIYVALTDNSDSTRLPSYAGDGTSGVYLYGAQVEVGSFPTSYIKTTGSTATRSVDVASIPVADFGWNKGSGTVVAEVDTADASNFGILWSANADSFQNRTLAYINNDLIYMYNRKNNGTEVNDPYANAPLDNTPLKHGYAFTDGDFNHTLNGGAVETVASNEMPVGINSFDIGNRLYTSGGHLNGHIKSIKYYPRRLTNAQLQDLTS